MRFCIAILSLILLIVPEFGFAFTDSVSLNGSSQYLSASSIAVTGSMTLECWIKTSTTGVDMDIDSKQGSGTTRSWRFFISSNVLVGVVNQTANGSTQSQTTGSVSVTGGTWIHIAMTFDSSTKLVALFENDTQDAGEAVNSSSATSINNSGSSVQLGTVQSGANDFNGKLFLCRVWNVHLSAATLAANNCTDLGVTANLQAEWTLDNTLNDDSGNSFTLTNVGSATFAADIPAACATPANTAYDASNWWPLFTL